MKRNALLCAMLALILFCSTQPAAALLSNERGTEIEGITRIPVIDVLVPANVNVLINPLELPVSIGDGVYTDQILCSPAYILSKSDIPLKVDVSLKGQVYPDSNMTLVSSPTYGSGTAKKAFVYFEMQRSDWEYPELVQWDPAYDSAKHIVIENGVTKRKNDFVTLPPYTDGMYGLPPEDAYVWFRLSGDTVTDPTSEWNEKDGLSVTVTFTFTPISYVN